MPYQTSTLHKVIAIVLAILTGGYLVPWMISVLRDLRTTTSVFWVNLLLGWTIIGWVVALFMSLRTRDSREYPAGEVIQGTVLYSA